MQFLLERYQRIMEMNKPFRFANNTLLCLSPDFILPKEKRPCLSDVSHMNLVPTIDLKGFGECHNNPLQNVSDACQKLGMFQIINHGVPPDLCQSVLVALHEFFLLPREGKAFYFTKDHTKQVKLFNHYFKGDDQKKVTMWSETFSHPWHPTEDLTHHLPTKPLQYRYEQ